MSSKKATRSTISGGFVIGRARFRKNQSGRRREDHARHEEARGRIRPVGPIRRAKAPIDYRHTSQRLTVTSAMAFSVAAGRCRTKLQSSGGRGYDAGGVEIFVEFDRLAVLEPPEIELWRFRDLACSLVGPGAGAARYDSIALRNKFVHRVVIHRPVRQQAVEIRA